MFSCVVRFMNVVQIFAIPNSQLLTTMNFCWVIWVSLPFDVRTELIIMFQFIITKRIIASFPCRENNSSFVACCCYPCAYQVFKSSSSCITSPETLVTWLEVITSDITADMEELDASDKSRMCRLETSISSSFATKTCLPLIQETVNISWPIADSNLWVEKQTIWTILNSDFCNSVIRIFKVLACYKFIAMLWMGIISSFLSFSMWTVFTKRSFYKKKSKLLFIKWTHFFL